MIIVQAIIPMRSGREDELLEVARRMARTARQQPGCVSFAFYAGVCEPSRLLLLQEWRDLEALRAHHRSDAMRDFVAQLQELVDGDVVTQRYSVEDPRPAEAAAAGHGPVVH